MAAIIESVITGDSSQADGRRAITERHSDSLGEVYFITYMAESGQDVTTILPVRAQQILEQRESQELSNLSNWIIAPTNEPPLEETFRYASQARYFAVLRERFQSATGLTAIRIAQRLSTLTNPQLRVIFDYTTAQATALRSKLTTMVDLANNIRSQVGE